MKNEILKEFKPTSWSIDNKTSIYVLAIIIVIFGMLNYRSIPKEQFPELVIPTIVVTSIYPGASPVDIENLITRPIEKNLKSINGVKKITSNSVQDFSIIKVEFNTDFDVAEAKQKVKDAVDKSKNDLPSDLKSDPSVMDVDFSEFPIMYLNIYGDISLDKLKKYAEQMQDRIESLKEITRVDIVGALDRELHIDVDMYKAQAANVAFSDIERAIGYENLTISGGTMDMYGMKRSIRVTGEIKNVEQLKNIIFKSSSGALIYLKDIANVTDSYKEQESYARLNNKNVITLNVIKKSGQNLLDASAKIKDIIKDFENNKLPSNVNVTVTGDQSRYTQTSLDDLNNTIIIGFVLVTIILMFFMGFTNAFFVGVSVPLSMCLAYIVMPGIGFTMNMLVMFSFIFALGIVVDDAIVVIENTHRIFKQNKNLNVVQAAKFAAGEVFLPIFSGTLTTLAPFFPLAFWPGIVGKFMFFIPVTLIITLFASLVVAYIFNPIFAVDFMKHEDDDEQSSINKKKLFTVSGIIVGIALGFYLAGMVGVGNFLIFVTFSYVIHNIYGYKILLKFQHRFIPAMMNKYEKLLAWVIKGRRPYRIMYYMVGLLILTFVIVGIKKPKVEFFPESDPNYINAYIKMPVGTSVIVTDSITKEVEKRIFSTIGDNNPIVESVISNVALGAGDPMSESSSMISSNKGKVAVAFVEYAKRNGESTTDYIVKIREAVKGIPGAEITVEQNKNGPPTGKPVNIEISGEDIEELYTSTKQLKKYLESMQIAGIEELKSDFEYNKPEILIDIDRERANREGVSTAQIGMEIRTAILGKEISKYRELEEQYPIMLRYNEIQRRDVDRLLNLKITYRDMNTGMLRQIPLSSIAKVKYQNSYGGINRKNLKRVITLSSNVLSGYTANEVVAQITESLDNFPKNDNIEIKMTGEQEDQQETMDFLSKAMILALSLILFILITQFNSLSKPIIIISEVLFSIIGVLLGYVIFDMKISIIMTGIGIVALAGIVVRNGILLVEFTDVLKERGFKTRDAIIQAGKTRITPVILTASATILGLIPLAFGLNINFVTLFTNFNPHIHFGGDNVAFFGPLAWTIIFGLTFATFLTLILIPVMYYIMYVSKTKVSKHKLKRKLARK